MDKETRRDYEEVNAANYFYFLPQQWRATNAIEEYDNILYGGTRGCAKSHWLRRVLPKKLIEWGRKYNVKNINAMLACESYPALQDRQIIPIEDELPDWLGVMKSTKKMGLHIQLHEKWQSHRILLRNLEKPEKYKSGQYAIQAIDQLEQIPERHYWILRGSNRFPGIPRSKFIATGNPLGVGHAWNVNYFIDHIYPSHVLPDQRKQFKFIPGSPYDNPFLPASYWRFLESLDKNLKRAWLHGDYHHFAGQAFPTFTFDTHVIGWDDPAIEGWKKWPSKWRTIDWGYDAPFACYWETKNPNNGRIVVYRELWENQLTDRQQARAIRDNTPNDEHININYADPSMWAKKNRGGSVETRPTSAADEYAKEGVPLTAADNNRMNGMRKFRNLLEPLPCDGRPGFLILETCYNLWRTLPQLVLEETGEDIVHDKNHKQEDHGYDAACRYGLTNELGEKETPPKPQEKSPLEKMMAGSQTTRRSKRG